MPKDIQLAIIKQVGWEWKQSKKEDWGILQTNFADGSSQTAVTIIKEDLLPSVQKVFDKYKRIKV